MAKAICLNCGELKDGAFNKCSICHSFPRTEDDRITSMILTEYYLDHQTILEYQDRIKKGAVVVVDQSNKALLLPVIKELSLLIDSNNQYIRVNKISFTKFIPNFLTLLESIGRSFFDSIAKAMKVIYRTLK